MGFVPWPKWTIRVSGPHHFTGFFTATATLRFSRYWFDLSTISRHRANRGTVVISSLFTAGWNRANLLAIPPIDRILPGPSTPRQYVPSLRPRRLPSSGHLAALLNLESIAILDPISLPHGESPSWPLVQRGCADSYPRVW